MESQVGDIFKWFGEQHIKVNVIQNSAISFTVCVEDKFCNFDTLQEELSKNFNVSLNENVSLYTIRHFNEKAAKSVIDGKKVLLQQVNLETMQIVTQD